MPFNSLQYLGFFAVVLVLAWALAGWPKIRIWFLLGASVYFYASNNHWQTLLIFLTTTVDYFICLRLERTDNERLRRRLVWISVVSNLGLLGWFKYSNFLGETFARIAGALGMKLDWVTLNVMLPIGISFYTFEALSYTIDVYRRKIPAERNWNRLAFLVTFFPHLIAGPIVRAADFFPQMNRRPRLSAADLESGLLLIASGVLKKMILADQLAPFADAAFSNPMGVGTARTWLGLYAFAFQIYFDFSGYTDIALGSAQLLGFQLPENFRRPYIATSITDFWRRWHMSLSTWLRDYLYIPLGGNRMRSKLGVYRNLMLTMLLGGLWHGASWTFAFWGGLHGAYLSIERALGIRTGLDAAGSVRLRLAVRILVFHLVLFSWIPFRSRNLPAMGRFLHALFEGVPGVPLSHGAVLAVAAIGGAWLWQLLEEKRDLFADILRFPLAVRALGYSFIAVAAFVLSSGVPKTFIYFRF